MVDESSFTEKKKADCCLELEPSGTFTYCM